MNRIFHSRIGDDGVLKFDVPLGIPAAGQDVRVTVESVKKAQTISEWKQWVAATAGAWQGDFERPDQGTFETRDSFP